MRPKKHIDGVSSTSVRLGDRYRFALKLIARTGETRAESTVIENAIEDIAGKLPISRHWLELWDAQPAVAYLNMISLPEYRPLDRSVSGAPSDAARADFISAHWQFFYSDKKRQTPIRANANVLWDDLDQLVTEWQKTKKTDYWSTAKKMTAMLKKAKLDPPSFG